MLILGSGSVARKQLLSSVGLVPDKIEISGIDESAKPNESPRAYVKRLAIEKSINISSEHQSFLITADTIVALGRRILSKTSKEDKARDHLNLLSGRRHNVFTAFCVTHNGKTILSLVKTSLKMRLLTKEEINAYINSGEWLGCAGAYSIQGRAKCFFPFISGCYTNVIGLPIPKLINVLTGLGFYKNKD